MQPSSTGPTGLTPQRIMQFAFGFAPTLILSTAVDHHIFDLLDAGPLTLDELSQKAGVSKRGLRAIAEALVAFEFLSRSGDRYSLTPESQAFLVRGKPGFHGGVLHHRVRMLNQWMQLNEVVATGKSAAAVNDPHDGQQFFSSFVEDLFPVNYPAAGALGRALKLGALDKPYRVLDIAAGSGVWGIALAEQSSKVHVTAVDWAPVLEVTRRVAERHGLGQQFDYVAGDLKDADFGAGYDLATLGHILHSEGAAASQSLIKKVYRSLAPGGAIAIAEFLRSDQPGGPPMPLIFAVHMLVCTASGDTYSASEIGRWLSEAGFVDVRTVEAPAPSPLVLATKPR